MLLPTLLAAEWRHHPWRQGAAVLAVALGVALAFAVHLINTSALAEFAGAVRAVNGQPDLSLRGTGSDGFDESLYARVATHPGVALASPVLELNTYLREPSGGRAGVRVVGIDVLAAPALLQDLIPQADAAALLDPGAVFLNPAARQLLGARAAEAPVQWGTDWHALVVRGDVATAGPPLLVMDIAGAQAAFGRIGRLSRIDVRLHAGVPAARVLADLALPPGVRSADPQEAQWRVSNLSRAYRVNLTVLALVALFTGAFLVFSVQALAVATRWPRIALLGVLGMSAAQRRRAVLAESALLGLLGAALGLVLGTALATLVLRRFGGDLGAGLLGGGAPPLQFSAVAALLHGALGMLAAAAGGWLPARLAERIAPAQALKGLGHDTARHATTRWWLPRMFRKPQATPPDGVPAGPRRPAAAGRVPGEMSGLALMGSAGVLALLPPAGGVPWAAYLAVALLLLGGIACVPAVVGLLLRAWPAPRHAAWLLGVQRARDQRHAAAVAVAGAVVALSLAVALTVMVASFRGSVSTWLDQVLPADIYVRTALGSGTADSAFLPPALADQAQQLPGVARVQLQRVASVLIDPARPPASLLVRPLGRDVGRSLPLVGPPQAPPPPPGVAVYVSEIFAAHHAVQPGAVLALPLPDGRQVPVHVRGVWRDYARPTGALAMDRSDWQRLTQDTRSNDLLVWLQPGASAPAVQAGLRGLLERAGHDPSTLALATAGEIRAESLRIFDRSFAVTLLLQGVAIAIGLFGIAAHFAAQVLARRKELGTLQHLASRGRRCWAWSRWRAASGPAPARCWARRSGWPSAWCWCTW